jgi:MoaA/NifB/PqqE/SkfB family radical SAM enzyme
MPRISSIHTAFIYLTERCNLNCHYCYFKNKGQKDLDGPVIERFLGLFGTSCGVPAHFEISGGEPLLRWTMVRRLALTLRGKFPRAHVGIQTNGLLLSADKADFIKHNRLAVEIGIDGDIGVTTRWRRRMGEAGFNRLVRNIRACVKLGIPVSCTMTVHPKEAGQLIASFDFIRSLGVTEIDVTPAAFMPWGPRARQIFQERYGELVRSSQARGKVFVAEDMDCVAPGMLDLSLHPPGHVLCGDPYLCLPEKTKAKYSLWDYRTGVLKPEAVALIQKEYRSVRKHKRLFTYRDQVCAGFEIVNRLAGRLFLNTDEIIPLMRFLSQEHRSLGRGDAGRG